MEKNGANLIFGRNSVRELLKSGREVDKIFVKRGNLEGSVKELIREAGNRGIPVVEVDGTKLDAMSETKAHQGILAFAYDKEYSSIDDILRIAEDRGEKPLIVICDGVEDPHNLGAIIRVADGAGAHGVIIPKRRAAFLTGTVEKASAGALEHVAVAKVTNIANTVDELKRKGLWIYAAEAGGELYYNCKFDSPMAIVMGSEGSGVSQLVKQKCDFLISIPMYGKVNSLNVSTASAVLLYEAARQLKSK
ncbi:MAG: 23S rRNA (guanosine(2251)-2'-O)-methyltransferase RlmB [Ruminococcaceae bacterium]|nr:23S rRNA (guanosine(2251)-2'-O)-methyltransferase RlmB [Oscillospiraceae bacterium]